MGLEDPVSEAKYTIVLTITCEDDTDDPRRWPFDDLLAPPEGEPDRYVAYIAGWKVER